MKNTITILIIVVLLGGITYLFMNRNTGLIDTSHYDKTVDSLKTVINKEQIIIDSLNNSVTNRNAKIAQYDIELANLKNKLAKERKQHEEDHNRISTLSNVDVTSEFTNEFK
jgi:CII-binding regulator of phage lambda lysogenization HflD